MEIITNTPVPPTFLTCQKGDPITSANPLPVTLPVGPLSVAAATAIPVSLPGAVFWQEALNSLAANKTYVGDARATGGTSGGVATRFNYFVAEVAADAAGVLVVEKSFDGVAWRQVGGLNLSASGYDRTTLRVSAPFYRVKFSTGLAAASAVLLTTSFTTA